MQKARISSCIAVLWLFMATVSMAQELPQLTLIQPREGATNVASPTLFSWQPGAGAVRYNLVIATETNNLASAIFNDSSIYSTSYTIPAGILRPNMTYMWRVRYSNGIQWSGFSNEWYFGTPEQQTVPPAPTLTSPTNHQQNVRIPVVLSWRAVTNTIQYNVQVSNTPDFSVVIFSNPNLTSSVCTVSTLAAQTLYYWRVSATNATGLGPWSATWDFTTSQLTATAPTLLSPANQSTNQPTTLALNWNAASLAINYRVQVSKNSNFQQFITDTLVNLSTTYVVSNLSANTRYYWRVGSIAAASSSLQPVWSTTWQFTTGSSNPTTAPVLLSPANKALNQSTTPVLSWRKVNTADSYNAQVATTVDFALNTIVFNKSNILEDTCLVTGLLPNTLYYWRVNSANNVGISPWSIVYSFTTGTNPSQPILISPIKAAINIPTNKLSMTWNAVPTATSYTLQVSQTMDFIGTSLIVNQANIQSNSYQINSLSQNTRYYWRVSATNAAGTGIWSEIWDFTTGTGTTLPAPTLMYPANNSVNPVVTFNFSWMQASGATSYNLQVSRTSDFSTTSLVLNAQNITNVSYPASNIVLNTTYYWRVNAVYQSGTSQWSEVWAFSTGNQALPAPTLNLPANNSVNQPLSLTCSWLPVIGASSYTLQVSRTADFLSTSLLFNQPNISTTSFPVNALTINTQYYWRVSASNTTGGLSPWSPVWIFNTGTSSNLTAPIPLLPANNSTNQMTTTLFTWNFVPGAVTYSLQVSKTIDFSILSIAKQNLTSTSYQTQDLFLAANTQYFWKVSATNATGGVSPWSEIWTFTTGANINAPILSLPVNNSTNQPTNISFTWNPTAGANSYAIQVSKTGDFALASIVADQQNIPITNFTLATLVLNNSYYWRVRAANSSGSMSPWSEIWAFSTGNQIPLPPPPVLLTPANKAINIPSTHLFTWNPVFGATGYALQIATSVDFSVTSIFNNSPFLTTNQCQITNLVPNRTYFWRVATRNASGQGSYGEIWSFTVGITGIKSDFKFQKNTLSFRAMPGIIHSHESMQFSAESKVLVKATLFIYDAIGNKVFSQPCTFGPNKKILTTWKPEAASGCGSYLAVLKVIETDGTTAYYKCAIGLKK